MQGSKHFNKVILKEETFQPYNAKLMHFSFEHDIFHDLQQGNNIGSFISCNVHDTQLHFLKCHSDLIIVGSKMEFTSSLYMKFKNHSHIFQLHKIIHNPEIQNFKKKKCMKFTKQLNAKTHWVDNTSLLNSYKLGEDFIKKYVSPLDMDTEFNCNSTNTGVLLLYFSVYRTTLPV